MMSINKFCHGNEGLLVRMSNTPKMTRVRDVCHTNIDTGVFEVLPELLRVLDWVRNVSGTVD